MRTQILLLLIPLAGIGCQSTAQLKPQPLTAESPAAVELKAPDMFVERYYYTPPKETEIRIGRYTSAKAASSDEQENLLNVVIQTEIPAKILTVGEAIRFLLMRSGYSLAPIEAQGKHVPQLLNKPLPHAHRKVGPIMLKDALGMIVGNAYWMSADPVHRLIAFDTVEEFK